MKFHVNSDVEYCSCGMLAYRHTSIGGVLKGNWELQGVLRSYALLDRRKNSNVEMKELSMILDVAIR